MMYFYLHLSRLSGALSGYLFILLLTFLPLSVQSQFQHLYGSGTSNSSSRVIPFGPDFYVLGDDNGLATISLIDQSGNWVWTTALNVPSVWSDGIIIPGSGNLIVVGYTLPSDPGNKSLIGEIMPDGTFSCIKTLDGPGNEALNRISANTGGTFTAVGYHTSGFRDVVIYNLSPNCTVNSKKQFFSLTNDFFDNDIEVLSGSGDYLVAGYTGNNALIYQMTSAGNFTGGVQGPGQYNYIDLVEMSNGDILAAANDTGSNPPRLIRFDINLFPLWEVSISGVTSLEQVVDGGNGNIYVVGTSTINGLARAIIVKINDGSGNPVLDWARYLENGETGYTGGAIASLSSGNIAFVDGRNGHANTFGLTDAFIAVTDGDLISTCSFDDFVFLTFENTIFDGPAEPELFESEFPLEVNLMGQSLDYLMAAACSSDTCAVELTYLALDSCGLVQICANTTGPQSYNYQWCDGQSTQCITTQLTCGPHDFCVTVTCGDASTASDSLTINIADTVPPVALCVPGFAIELDANCEYALTPSMIDGGSTDNCLIDSMSISPQILKGCGLHQVVLTVTDWCGNTSSCITFIQAAEFVAPIIMCPPNITLSCDDDVSPTITGFATATDNCDLNPTVTYVDAIFGTMPCDGYIERTWTATDTCDNTASCIQIITIEDDVSPTAICQSGLTFYLGNPCSVNITAAMMDAGSTDNCQLQSLTLSPTTITQCGTHLITLTATDFCGNTSTCQEIVTVLDTIPPTIHCPPDLTATAFFPECEVMVNNIHSGASDNCTLQSINYVITGATTQSGSGDASGEMFSEGLSTVSYTATDGCGNIDSCSFVVNVACDTCSCLGFTNLYFNNFDPALQVQCDSASVELPCISGDGLYSLQWTLTCSHPQCPQSVDYQIIPASGGPALLSGTAQFANVVFAYNQLAGPGQYQLILTGNCSGDTCACVINFNLLDCCDCGSFSGMTYQESQDSLILPVVCGDTLAVICNQLSDLNINGMFQCLGTQCAPYPVLNWTLKDSTSNTIQSGTVQALPGFSLALMSAWFAHPGLYTLTISGQCDGEDCPPCVFYFESEGCLPLPENCCFEWVDEIIGGFMVGNDIISDAAGNIYTTGSFSGTVDFDPGPGVFNLTSSGVYNFFVLKLDPAGNLVWALNFGPGRGEGWSIAIDVVGDIYIAGSFENTCDFDPGPATYNLTALITDGFWLKLDAAGNFIWAKQIKSLTSSSINQIFSIALDAAGNIYSTGSFSGTVDFDPGPVVVSLTVSNQCFVTKLDNNGNFIWAKHLERNFNGFSQGWSLSVDVAGNVYIMGLFRFSVDFDPSSSSVFNMTSTGYQEIFILKLDPAGNFVWAKQIEGTPGQHQHLGSIKISPSGDVIVGGSFNFTADFDPGPTSYNLTAACCEAFILNLDNNGNFVWAKQIGATPTGNTQLFKAMDFDGSGNIYISGDFWGVNDFDPGPNVYYYAPGRTNTVNTYILKLDPMGNFVWAKFLEGPGRTSRNCMAISPVDDIYSLGSFVGTIDFNPGTAMQNVSNNSNQDHLFIHKLSACPPDSCRSPVFSFIHLEPCKYRFQVQTIDNCYPFLRLQLDTGMFIGWIADTENGWIAEQLSATEILLTHSSGSIPVGANIPLEFDLSPGLQPNITIEWDSSCDATGCCVASFVLAGCHDGCTCGSFSDMFIRSPQDTINDPVICGGPPISIGCPTPGVSYTLTGNLNCEGESCLSEVDLDWHLSGPFGGLIASGTLQAAPWFTLDLSSAFFAQAGVYTLLLNGHCGTETCPCVFELIVEEGCADPCPCDLADLEADVQQGFAATLWNNTCEGCFSPLALSDCDEVEWHVGNPSGTPVGTSTGQQSFCYTFPGAGAYTMYMTVIRKRADGSLCESAVKGQTVNVTCQMLFDCLHSVLSNSGFGQGALAGSLNGAGTSEGWHATEGNPLIIEGEPGSLDGWTIQLTGNYDESDVLSLLEPICLEKDTGTISIQLRLFPWGDPHIPENDNKKWDFKARFYQGDNFDPDECPDNSCFQLASIDLTDFDEGWAQIIIPYNLNNWDVMGLCSGVLVRPVVYVTNTFGEDQGGDTTRARLQLDNLCIDGVLVGSNHVNQSKAITLFPNPTTGKVTLRFENNIPINAEVQILDIWGRTVQVESLMPGAREHTMHLNNLPTSVYILKVMEDGEPVFMKKVILL